MSGEANKGRKEFVGTVKSTKMNKSIIVDIVTMRPERVYRKYVKTTKRVMAHDEKNEARAGDTVRLLECRPLSKRKCWRLAEIVSRARVMGAAEASTVSEAAV